jgi:hypothetical protein
MSTLTISSVIVAFDDLPPNSNPTQTAINWANTLSNVPVDNPDTSKKRIQALGTATIFDGSTATAIDGTSAFSLATSTIDANRYRITNTGGTAPLFRTPRSVNCTGIVLTAVVNQNLTVTLTAGSGSPFSAVVVADTVFIPGVSTGDTTNVFDELNTGFWTVISKTSTVLVLARDPTQVFQGIGEAVTPASASQLLAFSSDKVQVGDTAEISMGFSTQAQHTYEVLAVTPTWFEFSSTFALGAETGILPTATGLNFYTESKRWIRVMGDQEMNIRLNGSTDNCIRVEPVIPGDSGFVGWYEMWGTIWSLVIVNRSTNVLNLTVLSAE